MYGAYRRARVRRGRLFQSAYRANARFLGVAPYPRFLRARRQSTRIQIARLCRAQFRSVRVPCADDDRNGHVGALWEKGEIYRHAQRRKETDGKRRAYRVVRFAYFRDCDRRIDVLHLFFHRAYVAACRLLYLNSVRGVGGEYCRERRNGRARR